MKPVRKPSIRRQQRRDRVFRSVRGLLVLGVLFAGFAAAASVLTKKPDTVEARKGSAVLPAAVMKVAPEKGYQIVNAFAGRIIARRAADIGFERGGLVAEVLVDDGAAVKQGQVIARLDTDKLKVALIELRARRAEVDARLAQATLTEERQKALLAKGHATKANFDDARFTRSALEAQRQSVMANIQSVELDLRKSVLKAPFDGRIANRRVDEGTVVAAGTPVARVLETGRLEARIGIPSDLVARLSVGSVHTLTLDGRARKATVSAISPDMNTTTRTVPVIFRLENGRDVPDGQIARLRLTRIVERPGFWVPSTALTQGLRGLWRVFVLKDAPGAPKGAKLVGQAAVEILHVSGSRVFVRGTLEKGDRIVATGVHRLAPGQYVTPVPYEPESGTTSAAAPQE